MNQEQPTATTDEFFNDIGTFETSRHVRPRSLSGVQQTSPGQAQIDANEDEQSMAELFSVAATQAGKDAAFLLPVRSAGLFRWALSNGMKAARPLTLMSQGPYSQVSFQMEPRETCGIGPRGFLFAS